MRLRSAFVHSPLLIHPSALSTLLPQHHDVVPIPVIISQAKYHTSTRHVVKLMSSESESEKDLTSPKQRIQRYIRSFRKPSLPTSNTWTIPDNTITLRQQTIKFFLHFLLETSLVASAFFVLASYIRYFANKVVNHRKFVIHNLTRWAATSLFIRMGMLHSRIISSVPSLARDENSDWFLKGSYRVLLVLGDCHNNESSIQVRVRQVPGNGSCLFHAISAGILYYDRSIASSDKNKDDEDSNNHPAMSKVIECSATLRTLAVDTLENGIQNNNEVLIMQNDETISAAILVEKAATQYGMTSTEYLSKMRRQNVWGGGPEIVSLANCLKRQIVLLEPSINDRSAVDNENTVYLKVIARFGPPSAVVDPIYILSTNLKFPKEYIGKRNNKHDHFLAVFPSQPF